MSDISFDFGTVSELMVAIAAIVSVAITSVVSWRIFKKEPAKTYVQDRYERIIYPVFILLEKHMFNKDITPEISDTVQICKQIIDDNRMIAGGDLLNIFSYPLTVDNFYRISCTIDKQYNKACKQLGIPTRSLLYKARSYKWKYKKLNMLCIITYFVILPILVLCALAIAFCVMMILASLFIILLSKPIHVS